MAVRVKCVRAAYSSITHHANDAVHRFMVRHVNHPETFEKCMRRHRRPDHHQHHRNNFTHPPHFPSSKRFPLRSQARTARAALSRRVLYPLRTHLYGHTPRLLRYDANSQSPRHRHDLLAARLPAHLQRPGRLVRRFGTDWLPALEPLWFGRLLLGTIDPTASTFIPLSLAS